MFRSADAFGIEKIFLTGYTPAPVDRFGRSVSKIAKTALGAEKTIPWERIDMGACVVQLKKTAVKIIALEQDPRATPLNIFVRNLGFGQSAVCGSWALMVGNEVDGLDQGARTLADHIVEVPMAGHKESLNVAVAAGIALHTLSSVPN